MFVSVQPLLLRNAARILVRTAVGVVSLEVVVTPYPTASKTLAFGKVQGVAVAPQAKVLVVTARATLPLVADIFKLVELVSGVGDNVAPVVPKVPNATR